MTAFAARENALAALRGVLTALEAPTCAVDQRGTVLFVNYQPVMSLATGRATAVEALVRWEHPGRGTVPPDQFIPMAERNGLIIALGRWVLRQACRDATAFEGLATGIEVAVNVSPRQLTNPGFIGHVRDALADSGLAPERLSIEVTESALLADPGAAALALEEVARLGVRIALDDFGAGNTTLARLRSYPISTLKIDNSLVAGLNAGDRDVARCQSVIGLAEAIGAGCVAEGVETMAQRAALMDLQCPQAQGFLWSPAVPLHQLEATLVSVDRAFEGLEVLQPGGVARRRLT